MKRLELLRFGACALTVSACALSSCGGGGSVTPSTLAPQTSAPSPLDVTPASLSFLGVGASQTQAVVASEANYAGGYTTGSGCNSIATVALYPGTTNRFDVTPIAAGRCTLIVTGAPGQTQSVSVSITTTSVVGQ